MLKPGKNARINWPLRWVVLSLVIVAGYTPSPCSAEFDPKELPFLVWAPGTKWEPHIKWLMYQEFTCKQDQPLNDLSPCNYFVGNALSRIYGVDDFKKGDGFLLANEIYEYVLTHKVFWKELGFVANQAVATNAQKLANKGLPVIALRVAKPYGHVALIIPGKLTRSHSWNMDLPNSASFRLNPDGVFDPKRHWKNTYIGEPLSWSWTPEPGKDVKIFYRADFLPATPTTK